MKLDEIELIPIREMFETFISDAEIEVMDEAAYQGRAVRLTKELWCARLTPCSTTKDSDSYTTHEIENVPLTWWDHFKASRGWKHRTRQVRTVINTVVNRTTNIDMLLPFNVSLRPGGKPSLYIPASDPCLGPVKEMFRAPSDGVIRRKED